MPFKVLSYIKLLNDMGLPYFQFIFLINCCVQIRALPQPVAYITLHKKSSFPLRISQGNMTKSAGSHLPTKSWMRNFIFVKYKDKLWELHLPFEQLRRGWGWERVHPHTQKNFFLQLQNAWRNFNKSLSYAKSP